MYARRPPRVDRSAATHEKIVRAVRELLAEGVFHESTVEQIATRAGVSRATLYQHFRTRLGLVDALCDSFDANPALLRLRQDVDLDEWIDRVVAFWASEEKVLEQLYGVAAVDPAAAELVERQRTDRYSELRRLLARLGDYDRTEFAALAALTSFDAYRELRRGARLSRAEVVRTIQTTARAVLRMPAR
jgi:AcrR family transcriptional regulator